MGRCYHCWISLISCYPLTNIHDKLEFDKKDFWNIMHYDKC